MNGLTVLAFIIFNTFTLPVHANSNTIGRTVIPLNGPWRFHTGDNLNWGSPGFDDSGWETTDLTSAPGAHDGDVGLSGYVPGWAAKGHAGYSGYAWYRMYVTVSVPAGTQLAIAGPPDVDDAYQLFVNGALAGCDGDFSTRPPTVYSIQPRLFILPKHLQPAVNNGVINIVIAFRVWAAAGTMAAAPDAGGIHIAPSLGDKNDIAARYHAQWVQTFWGYVVDAIEPLLFIILAVIAFWMAVRDRTNPAYRWIGVALLLTALVRSNQVFFYWMQFESTKMFDIVTTVILIPAVLFSWIMTWRAWFKIDHPKWAPKALAALTLLYMILQLLGLWWILPAYSPACDMISTGIRLLFILLLLFIVYKGTRKRDAGLFLTVAVIILISVGLFASELSAIGVAGIWFPYGVGVSRTQFAYAAFDIALLILLIKKLLAFQRNSPGGYQEI